MHVTIYGVALVELFITYFMDLNAIQPSCSLLIGVEIKLPAKGSLVLKLFKGELVHFLHLPNFCFAVSFPSCLGGVNQMLCSSRCPAFSRIQGEVEQRGTAG